AQSSAWLRRGARIAKGGRICSGYWKRFTWRPRLSDAGSPHAWSARMQTSSGAVRSSALTGRRASLMRLLPPAREQPARELQRAPFLAREARHALAGDLVQDAVGAPAQLHLLDEALALAADRGALEGEVDARLEGRDDARGREAGDRRPQPLVHPPRAGEPAGAEQDGGGGEPQREEEEEEHGPPRPAPGRRRRDADHGGAEGRARQDRGSGEEGRDEILHERMAQAAVRGAGKIEREVAARAELGLELVADRVERVDPQDEPGDVARVHHLDERVREELPEVEA